MTDSTRHDEIPVEVLEALATGRDDLVPAEWRARVANDVALRERVAFERALSIDVGLLMEDAAPALDPRQLDAMVASALDAQPVSRRALWLAGTLGFAVTAAFTLAGRVPTLADGIRAGRDASVVLGAWVTVMSQVPGGYATLAVAALALMTAAAWPARRWLGGGARTTAVALAFVALSVSGGAHAQRFEGEWPDAESGVTLDLEQVPASAAIRQAAESVGLGVVVSLPSDPNVSLHVVDAPLRDVLAAILADDAWVVRRSGSMISIRRASPERAATPVPPPVPDAPASATPTRPVPAPPPVPAGPARDRTSMGNDVTVAAGERVRDLVTMGGDAHVIGEVTGDVTTMGGDLLVEGLVRGDVVTMGGDIEVAPGGQILGDVSAMGGEVRWGDNAHHGESSSHDEADDDHDDAVDDDDDEVSGRIARFGLLFLLGLFLLGGLRERHARMARAFTKSPFRSGGIGLLAAVTCVVLTLALAITLIGIPAAIVLAAGGFVGLYVGIAIGASVVGAVIPLESLQGRPVAQLAAGTAALLAVSFIPFFGTVTLALVAMVGFGSVVTTRFGRV